MEGPFFDKMRHLCSQKTENGFVRNRRRKKKKTLLSSDDWTRSSPCGPAKRTEREQKVAMVTNFHLQALMRAMNNTFLKGYDILFITCCTLRLKRHLPVKKYNNTHLLKHAAVQFVKVDFTFFVRTSQNLEKPNDRCVNYPC